MELSRRRAIATTVLFFITAYVLIYQLEIVEVSIKVKLAESLDKLDATLIMGDEIDVWLNFLDWSTSVRGERFLTYMLNSFLFCWAVHFLVREIWKFVLPPERYNSFSIRDRMFFAQKIPSSIHAIVVGVFAIKLVWQEQLFATDIIDSYHDLVDVLIAFSFGYEIYDIIVMYVQTEAGLVMFIHHYALCFAYFLSVIHKKMAFVAVAMLVTELTVLPSNLHWYLKELGLKDNRLFHFNQGVRFWSFVAIRLTVPPFVAYEVYKHFTLFNQEIPLARYSVYIVVALLSLMNIYWTKVMGSLYFNRTTLAQKRALATPATGKPKSVTKKNPSIQAKGSPSPKTVKASPGNTKRKTK